MMDWKTYGKDSVKNKTQMEKLIFKILQLEELFLRISENEIQWTFRSFIQEFLSCFSYYGAYTFEQI